MRDREDFVRYAAVKLMYPSSNEAQTRDHAKAAKAGAEALADELGLKNVEPRHFAGGSEATDRALATLTERCEAAEGRLRELQDLGVTLARVDELEQLGAINGKRIADLEADLERATAPKGKAK